MMALETVLAYFSRQTTKSEQKDHSFELEALAVVSSIKRFRQYFLGRSFTVVTHCVIMKCAFGKTEINARVGRWVMN
jgi:hypothetical protein